MSTVGPAEPDADRDVSAIQWECVFEQADSEPSDWVKRMNLQLGLCKAGHADSLDSPVTKELIDKAVEEGILEKKNSTYRVVGAAPVETTEEEQEEESLGLSEVPRDDLESKVRQKDEKIDELENKVGALEGKVNALETKFQRMTELLTGDKEGLAGVETEHVQALWPRLQDVEDSVKEHQKKLEMFTMEDGSSASPDDRARQLRQVLYNKATRDGGRSVMDRDSAIASLGGDVSRQQALDAMRRAADGDEAEKINGTSNLQPVDILEFKVGSKRDQQSKVEMDITNTTKADLRNNITTKPQGEGGH